jgi:glycosyltransferase involved in cell wall biosynthesis
MHATEAPLGGVLSYLQELIACQLHDDRIAEIHVVTPDINRPVLEALAHPKLKLTIHTFPHERGSPAGLMRLARLATSVAWRSKPHVAHVHSTFAGAVLRPILRLTRPGLPIVYCPHGWAFSREGNARANRLIALVERTLSWATHRIVCISHYECKEALRVGISPSKCAVIQNGIGSQGARPAPASRVRAAGARRNVLFVGRFDRQKGFDIFLEVMSCLADLANGTAVGSYIVSPEAPPAVPPNVRVLGWRSREGLEELYRSADLLLVPSRWEGFGLVAVEGMRAGLPVFASRVGGLQEVVRDGVTGRLVRSG